MKRRNSISTKMIILFIFASVMTLLINVIMYYNINRVLDRIDLVYETNVQLNTMADELEKTHQGMYQYLTEKGSSTLQNYYTSEQNFRENLEKIKVEVTESRTSLLKNNIYHMGQKYLSVAGEVVKAKRGRNIKVYHAKYKEADNLYRYITAYITRLNNIQFQSNSDNYRVLQQALRYLEVIGTIMLLVVILCDTIMVVLLTGRITKPLTILAKRSNEVTKGNMNVEIPVFETSDEVEILSKSFDSMMISIRNYIEKSRESLEKENEMREKELKTQALLKDAQLKYLQSQINPHFLFNTLNAGMQLATIEDAEQTAVFIENMAEFFRYNLSKINQAASLKDEIQLVDHYIYILNVRFSGDIHFEKEIDEELTDFIVPSMILQPLVENAVQYGIRDIDWEGKIWLRVYREDDTLFICIEDNGRGMSEELIDRVMKGESVVNEKNKKSNGIGVYNVLERLRMYYHADDVMDVYSAGENKGTCFTLKLPYEKGGEGNV